MNTYAVIAILIVLGVLPVWALVAIFTSDWWKTSGWKQTKRKFPAPLIVIGVVLLVMVLIQEQADNSFQPPERVLRASFTTVNGTVEAVEEADSYYQGKFSNYYYTIGVQVQGEWYETVFYYYGDDEELQPEEEWLWQSEGQTVTLKVWDGMIYGITNGEGTVILDAEATRLEAYDYFRSSREECLGLGGVSAAMIGTGLVLILLRKPEDKVKEADEDE